MFRPKRQRIISGLPASSIAYGDRREMLAGIDENADLVGQLTGYITELQTSLSALQDQVTDTNARVAAAQATNFLNPNFIVNGDISQWCMANPMIGITNDTSTVGFLCQQRAMPIMDRWFHVMDVTALQLNAPMKVTAQPMDVDTVVGQAGPQLAKKMLKINWTCNSINYATPRAATSTAYYQMYYSMIGIQHLVHGTPKTFQGKSFCLGFWLKSNNTSNNSQCVNVFYQYNMTPHRPDWHTKTGSDFVNDIKAQPMKLISQKSFPISSTWTYYTFQFTCPADLTTSPYSLDTNNCGLLIQICPFYYYSYYTNTNQPITFQAAGDHFISTNVSGPFFNYDMYITEIQLQQRNDVLLSTSFPLRENEEALCQPYIQKLCSAPPPDGSTNYEGFEYGFAERSAGDVLDNDGNLWTKSMFQLRPGRAFRGQPRDIFYITDNATNLRGYLTSRSAGSNYSWYMDARQNTPALLLNGNPILNNLDVRCQYTQCSISPNMDMRSGIVSNIGAGDFTVNFSPAFSTTPSLTCWPVQTGASANLSSGKCCFLTKITAISTTQASFTVYNLRFQTSGSTSLDLLKEVTDCPFNWLAIADNQNNSGGMSSQGNSSSTGRLVPAFTTNNVLLKPRRIALNTLGLSPTLVSLDFWTSTISTDGVTGTGDTPFVPRQSTSVPASTGDYVPTYSRLLGHSSSNAYFVALCTDADMGKISRDDIYYSNDTQNQSMHTYVIPMTVQ